MESKNLIILALVAIVLVLAGVIFATSINTPTNDTNSTNDTVNVTLNDTNETNNTTTTTNTKEVSSSKKSSKSDSNIVDESIKENYQAGDGSHYREVKYKDGNIRQYDRNGKLIGSSYESDQAQLKRDAGDSWPGD